MKDKKYAVFDLNYKQIEIVFEYKEKKSLKNIFKGIKSINKYLIKDFIYETNNSNYYLYNNLYVLKRNNNEAYFIGKHYHHKIFKVFKYTYTKEEYNNIAYKIDSESNFTNPGNIVK